MGFKLKSGLLAMMSMFAQLGNFNFQKEKPKDSVRFDPEQERKRSLTAAQRYREILRSRGVKDFTIDGITVMAINYKNALRKAGNIKRELGLHGCS